jgi:hypothetical protein
MGKISVCITLDQSPIVQAAATFGVAKAASPHTTFTLETAGQWIIRLQRGQRVPSLSGGNAASCVKFKGNKITTLLIITLQGSKVIILRGGHASGKNQKGKKELHGSVCVYVM